MEVLAEFLSKLAVLFGAPHAVHFVRIEPGSAVPVINVDKESAPAVRERIRAVKSGNGPIVALRAYQAINQKLKDINGSGRLLDIEEGGAEVINFPGHTQATGDFGAIRKQGTLDGEVIRVGGKDRRRVSIQLQIEEDRVISYVHTRKALAEELGHRLYKPVRLYGSGRWRRDPIGFWNLEDFSVDRFEPLKADKLSTALVALRAVGGGEWNAKSLDELRRIRDGEDD